MVLPEVPSFSLFRLLDCSSFGARVACCTFRECEGILSKSYLRTWVIKRTFHWFEIQFIKRMSYYATVYLQTHRSSVPNGNNVPPASRLCFCFYLKHSASKVDILLHPSVTTHIKPVVLFQNKVHCDAPFDKVGHQMKESMFTLFTICFISHLMLRNLSFWNLKGFGS